MVEKGDRSGENSGLYNLRVYVVRTAGKRERRTAEDLMKAARRLGIEISEVRYHPSTRGYVYVVCRNMDDLSEVVKRVPGARQIVGEMGWSEFEALFNAEPEFKKPGGKIHEYDTVVITHGPEEGSRGMVESIKNGVAVVVLQDELIPRRVEVPLGHLKKAG